MDNEQPCLTPPMNKKIHLITYQGNELALALEVRWSLEMKSKTFCHGYQSEIFFFFFFFFFYKNDEKWETES